MADTLATLVLFLIIILPVACLIYKYRAQIKRWVTNVNYGDIRNWGIPRKTRAERSIVEAQWKLDDARAYLDYLNSKPDKVEEERG